MSLEPLQLARVGSLYQTGLAQSQISDVEKKLIQIEQQISTGKSLINPSDNPSNASVAMQLQKTLDQRQTYLGNLYAGQSQLGVTDNSLSSLNDLLQQAQTIASANLGAAVTPAQRQGAAAIVDGLYNQAMTLANTQFQGVYIFGGDKSTTAPFVTNGSGVEFVGSQNVLKNAFDANTNLAFMVNGAQAFGQLPATVPSSANLTPNLTGATRLNDVGGTSNDGVHLGSIVVGNGSVSATIDLSKATSVQDVINTINAAGVGGITASIGGQGMTLSGAAGDNITVKDIGGGKTATDLGILRATGAGAGAPLVGSNIQPRLTPLTPLAALKAGAPVDLTSGLKITSGQQTYTISFAGATNVQDLLNAINSSGAGVTAQINAAGTGIEVLNPTQGMPMTIGENGGTTATDLGIRSLTTSTPLSDLNNGRPMTLATSGADFSITRADGTTFSVSISGAITIQDVINDINTADAGGGITAAFATTGNGIVLSDSTSGGSTLTVTPQNFSSAAADLGLTTPTVGNTIFGADVNPITTDGVFSHLAQLRNALNAGDDASITSAAQGLKDDQNAIITIRGQVGARVQEMQSRQSRIQDENVATNSLLSNLTDTDFTTAITKFQTLQQSLQASLETASRVMNQSLMDFLQ